MKLLSVEGEELASIAVRVDDERHLSTAVTLGNTVVQAPPIEVAMENTDDGLAVRVRVPGVLKCSLLIEYKDVRQMLKLPGRGVVMFGMKALTSRS